MSQLRALGRLTVRAALLCALLSGVASGASRAPDTELSASAPTSQRGAVGFGLRLEAGAGPVAAARADAITLGLMQQVRLSKDLGGPFSGYASFRLWRGFDRNPFSAAEGSLSLGASARWQPSTAALWLEAGLGARGGFLGLADDPQSGHVVLAPELSLSVERWFGSWFSVRLAPTWCPALFAAKPHHRVDVVLLVGLAL